MKVMTESIFREELANYIPTFVSHRKRDIKEMLTFLDRKDLNSIKFINHKFKGICLPYGFLGLHNLAYELKGAYGDWEKMTKVINEMVYYIENVDINEACSKLVNE